MNKKSGWSRRTCVMGQHAADLTIQSSSHLLHAQPVPLREPCGQAGADPTAESAFPDLSRSSPGSHSWSPLFPVPCKTCSHQEMPVCSLPHGTHKNKILTYIPVASEVKVEDSVLCPHNCKDKSQTVKSRLT